MAREVFVSYSQPDHECALEVVAQLEARGISVWIASRDVRPAATWAEEILTALSQARVVVLVLSSHSNVSPQVSREIERAVEKRIPVLPFRIEPVKPSRSLEYFLSTQQWLDAFPPPLEPHFQRLCEHVAALLNEAPLERAGLAKPVPARKAPLLRQRRIGAYAGWVAAGLAVAVSIVLQVLRPSPEAPAEPLPVSRLLVMLPPSQRVFSGNGAYPLAISADGARVAYVATNEGMSQLAVRELDEIEPRFVAGTQGAEQPFFSPDGEWLGFFADGTLQKVAIAGGPPIRICNVPTATLGASWGAGDTIVFTARSNDRPLMKVSANGGAPAQVDTGGRTGWPQFLPDGKTLLFTIPDVGVATIPADGGALRVIAQFAGTKGDGPTLLGAEGQLAQARYVPSGHIVFGQAAGIVRAFPFDLTTLTATGPAVSLMDSLERAPSSGAVYFAVASNGTIVYATTAKDHSLVWVSPLGVETPISSDKADFRNPRVSPDGQRILVTANDDTRRSDVWLFDAERTTKSRLTNELHNLDPTWAPAGASFAFASEAGIEEAVTATAASRAVFLSRAQFPAQASIDALYPTDWSPDGRELLAQDGYEDIWVIDRGTSSLKPLLVGASRNFDGKFSPNGQWIAFTSDESGREEVYVAKYPSLAERTVVSTGGGQLAVWSRSGTELFYRRNDDVMAAKLDLSGAAVKVSSPRRLFGGPYFGASHDARFDVAPDGRFAMVRSNPAATLDRLVVVQNWFRELQARAPSKPPTP